ncbi:MAG: hypothetical protein WBV82_08020, partial [Myxococcaceae bacterium]
MPKPIQACVSFAAIAFLGLTGCDDSFCHKVQPRCAFDLRLAHSWEEGRYEFEFRRDGSSVLCAAQLPLADGANFACDDGGNYFQDPFDRQDQNRPFPETIRFFSTPEQVEVVIRHDGGEIA